MTRKAAALRHLKQADPYFYRVTRFHHRSLPARLPEKRTRAALFAALVSIVIAQQLGTAAADTILARVQAACQGRLTPLSILKMKPSLFHRAGLSGAKTKTLKVIAGAIENGALDLLALKTVPEMEAARTLTNLWGLGPWSVDMFMMFALGHENVFSSGDLGLVRAMGAIYHLPKDSSRSALITIAEKWSPYRTYACLLLWRTRDAKFL